MTLFRPIFFHFFIFCDQLISTSDFLCRLSRNKECSCLCEAMTRNTTYEYNITNNHRLCMPYNQHFLHVCLGVNRANSCLFERKIRLVCFVYVSKTADKMTLLRMRNGYWSEKKNVHIINRIACAMG